MPGQVGLTNATMAAMSDATPLPRMGEVFFDDRGEERALRLSWHADSAVMVFSMWNRGVCSGTFRLMSRDVPAFMEALSQAVQPSQPQTRQPVPEAPAYPEKSYGDQPYTAHAYANQPPAEQPWADRQYGGRPYGDQGYAEPAAYTADPGPATEAYVPPFAAGGGNSYVTTGQYDTDGLQRQRPPETPPSQPQTADPLEVLKSLSTSQRAPDARYPRTGEYRPPRNEY